VLCCCTADAMLTDTVNSPMALAIEEISSTDRLWLPG
jgi:hypothetical protein